MSHPLLRRWQGRVRRRRALIVLSWTLPLALALAFAAYRHGPPTAVLVLLAIALVAIVGLLVRHWRAVDLAFVARGFDRGVPELEDSCDLLLDEATEIPVLGELQRKRIRLRLASASLPDLRPPWPWRRVGAAVLCAVAIVVTSLTWPAKRAVTPPPSAPPGIAGPEHSRTRLVASQIDIEAPSYTGLAIRREPDLEVSAVTGSRLRWTLRFDPQPESVRLAFHDGKSLPLMREGAQWTGEAVLDESTLYRIVVSGPAPMLDDRLLRLDAISDQAPLIRLIEPDRTLSTLGDGQQTWSLDFEVSDDFGIADARLRVTLAQGSGEQVTTSERTVSLRAEGGGDPRHRRYRHRFALRSLGFAAGDDLIVRLEVSDNRQPKANQARSASYILRWPPELAAQSEGVEGIVQKVLPAYFRSQRQIIIDTEALIGERPQLSAERFLARSDSIGVDQKILRLRYGQFLGEEFESGRNAAAPEADHADEGAGKATQQDALSDEHAHDAGAESDTRTFGRADDVLEQFGHTHDHAEAATLLDPETKKLLKSALAEMWQAELHLRLGEPTKALPYENRALGFIKQVQQSTRIYLARVGLELPQADESRRLSGERAGLRDPRGVLSPAKVSDPIVGETYRALMANAPIELDAFEAWLREHSGEVPDALGLIAACDSVRRQPECADCRQVLLDRLWAILPTPAANVRLRHAPDSLGRAYLDALGAETRP